MLKYGVRFCALVFFLLVSHTALATPHDMTLMADKLLPHELVGLRTATARIFKDVLGEENIILVDRVVHYAASAHNDKGEFLFQKQHLSITLPIAIYQKPFSGIEKLYKADLVERAKAPIIDSEARPPVVIYFAVTPAIIFDPQKDGTMFVLILPSLVRTWRDDTPI